MPIGEFGGAPPLVAEGSPALTTPMYWMYEMAHASLNPVRAVPDAPTLLFPHPLNPWSRPDHGTSLPPRRQPRAGYCLALGRLSGRAVDVCTG